MKSILAIILALTGAFNTSTSTLLTNSQNIANELSSYEIFVEANFINNVEQTDYATNYDVFYTLLSFYATQNDIEMQPSRSFLLSTCKELGFITDDNFTLSDFYDQITYGQLATILCDYLRATDNFLGATAGVKYNISNFDDIDAQYQYDVLSLYSQGILSEQFFDENQFITVGATCEYIAKILNLKPKDTVDISQNYLPIVMYHSVSDDFSDVNDYIISSETFENDLIYLQNRGYTTLFVADLVEILENDLDFPEKPILLTFDDGYEDNYTNVYRLLAEYNMKGIVAPVALHYYEYVTDAFAHLTTEQTIEMSQSGVIEFSNHSYDLHTNDDRFGTLRKDDESLEDYREFLLDDLTKAHTFYIENGIDEPINYAYPYGASSAESEQVMKDFGYISTFVTDPAYLNIIETFDDLYGLTRLNRPDGLTSEEFFAELEMLDLK